MSPAWNAMNESARRAARRRFAVETAAAALADPDPPRAPRPPRFDELYAACANPAPAALARTAGARAAFEALLRDTALCWFPVAAAAASGGLDARACEGFRIWIRPSNVVGQAYVLVRAAAGARPSALVACPPGGAPVSATLPEDVDGVYQLVAREDSTLIRAIRDPAATLALR